MVSGETLYWLLPARIRRLPADLAAVLILLGLADLAVFAPGLSGTTLQFALVLPLLTILPGYAAVAALYPERGGPGQGEREESGTGGDGGVEPAAAGIDWYERVVLSVGVSIALVPLLAYGTIFVVGRLRVLPLLFATNAVTISTVWIADRRRRSLPDARQFSVPYRQWIGSVRTSLLESETRTDLILNVVLLISVLLAIGSAAYVLTAPKPSDAHTEFYLLTENESGELVASDYPRDFERGVGQELVVGITNQEHADRSYSVVTVLQRVRIGNDTIDVLASRELQRYTTRLAHGEQWRERHTVTPTMTGDRLRLAYLLYEGEVPAEPGFNNADDLVFIWINVTSAATAG